MFHVIFKLTNLNCEAVMTIGTEHHQYIPVYDLNKCICGLIIRDTDNN